jgi:hypothetical protein
VPLDSTVLKSVEDTMAQNWFTFCQNPANAPGILQAGTFFQESVAGIRNLLAQSQAL